MKKYLFLAVSIFSIFFITDNVNALSFNMNGEQVEVNNENYIYYLYTLQPELFEEYDYFLSFMNSDGSYRFAFTNDTPSTSSHGHFSLGTYFYITKDTYYCRYTNTFNLTSCEMITKSTSYSIPNTHSYFYNFDIYDNRIPGFSTANITKDDLKNVGSRPIYKISYYINNELYQTLEVEEGTSHNLLDYSYNSDTHIFSGWQYDETLDFTNITSDIIINATLEKKDVIPVYIEFPINKNEFYALLVEVGVLIMIIFLKWCFPFKGGSDLK